ncbi:hypothetical protein [Gemmobacter sp. LW-1]|uniref:hypothetical protein n=1 Tax=Gemmobacter sp. LW-1 TaxID=1529005 RepID=UPI0006C74392|nr:hypothetical protein [Gemmobacter sp. LW-1]
MLLPSRPAPVLALALLLSPLAAAAQTPITAAEFEAYATGKTLTYAQGGTIFGTEQYLPNRRVRWAFTAQECQEGHWYEADSQICFVYESESDPQCWAFWQEGGRLKARFAGDPDGTELTEVEQSKTPLACAGPDVGV